MNLLAALRYFAREAALNLVRGWKVSLLAVLTIAVPLVLGGTFLLASRNLSRSVESWRGEMRVILYLRPGTTAADLARLRAEVAATPWVKAVDAVSSSEARRRFRRIFPSLADLVEGWQDEPLPASLEVALRDHRSPSPTGFDSWLAAWRRRPEIAMVDDDREWLDQLETVIAIVRAAGLVIGAILLGAAIFTIGSIIRLTAYLHHEEIAIMRLVGSTEFFIRGPFYAEGVLQGLIGGGAASLGLYAAYRFVHSRPPSLLASVLATDFLSASQMTLLVLVGGAAGLLGAIASLRRETFSDR